MRKTTNDGDIGRKVAFLERAYASALMAESCKNSIQRLKDELEEAALVIDSGGRRNWRAGRLDDVSALLMDKIDEYAREIARHMVIESEIQEAVGGLKNTLFQYILLARYINNKSVSEIARSIHYSRSSVMRFQRLALEELKIEKPEA